MASLKSIKKRIVSVKNTGQITKAMKMVSAAKLRRAQENVVAARPYAAKLGEVLGRLSRNQDADSSPLMIKRTTGKALLIVVTSDRGLCGGFNANLCKAAERFVKERGAEFTDLSIMTIGRKGYEFLKNRQKIRKNFGTVFSNLNYQTAALLAQEVIQGYLDEEFDEVFIIYNAFRSVMSQDITLEQLLPVTPPEAADEEYAPEYIYEPSKSELLGELLPKHIEVQIFKSLLESVASEHGARMTAMDSASKNANEMIGKLTLQYNRARQAAITTELMEIISGAESIKG
ncbi:ATP synthase F1, gamma subunit [Geotalea daltonii FRC-32]|uniref:ATP synthase gamma chain n=1 Tax=Geotalea daltonii (strain DSM 22248 / JCM 15807 / FRC-32) TaxID=316067 RepID=ATPG_GEODF|nr:ATP synthase F1 subunit gamma [Geotalea daltonii]B9LZ85.1 RecName: Full=ATP synthase gamma chain; AltName: Full=ATP synthase F1 sector gamma subunit; AltName: Full=F-ATPase gamma subunit [Geotalea daltonii FRC-32]ACM18817.1 ATP synthase F1, gamma subunit [Geotalea daltonii FRC-32]